MTLGFMEGLETDPEFKVFLVSYAETIALVFIKTVLSIVR